MKKILLIAAVAVAAFSAKASYLYWQVSSEAVAAYATDSSAIYGVQVTLGGNAVTQSTTDGTSTGSSIVSLSTAQSPGYYIDLASYSSSQSSFVIEIIQYDTSSKKWSTIAQSESLAYTAVSASNYVVDTTSLTPGTAVAWTGGTYGVPEPTSGMLAMIGFALMALKRRRQ